MKVKIKKSVLQEAIKKQLSLFLENKSTPLMSATFKLFEMYGDLNKAQQKTLNEVFGILEKELYLEEKELTTLVEQCYCGKKMDEDKLIDKNSKKDDEDSEENKEINEGLWDKTKKAVTGLATVGALAGNAAASPSRTERTETSAHFSNNGDIKNNDPFRNGLDNSNASTDVFATFIPELQKKYTEFLQDSNNVATKLKVSPKGIKAIIRLGSLNHIKQPQWQIDTRRKILTLLQVSETERQIIEKNIQTLMPFIQKYSKYIPFLYEDIMEAIDGASSSEEQKRILRVVSSDYKTKISYTGGEVEYVKYKMLYNQSTPSLQQVSIQPKTTND